MPSIHRSPEFAVRLVAHAVTIALALAESADLPDPIREALLDIYILVLDEERRLETEARA